MEFSESCSIIYFPDWLTLGTYTGTLYLRGGAYWDLSPSIGITTENAMALSYQQISLTLLLVDTSNPQHIFSFCSLWHLGATGQCVWMRIWRERTGDLLQSYVSLSRSLLNSRSPVMLECQHWSSAKEVRRTTLRVLQWKFRFFSLGIIVIDFQENGILHAT